MKFLFFRHKTPRKESKRSLQALKTAAIAFSVWLTAFFALHVFVGSYEQRAAAAERKLPIYSVETTEKKIAISFDCAWGVEYTDRILTELDRHNVKCTFFAVEFWVEKYPEYAKKIVERGHELGTHSKTHPYMSKLTKGQVRDELTSSMSAIEETAGVKPTLFRPPYGDYNNTLIETAIELGLYTIQWDVDSLDWKNLSATELSLRVINGVKEGSIILCHNNGLHTAEALPMIFSTLQNRGYEFVPIGDLIIKQNYTVDHTGRQHPAS
ncbi:MAG: polysaccharide deacetylase family protein [Clostridia bacterium]|nr:polysaccharide deacetylase family protein [Clostridia bacterium]